MGKINNPFLEIEDERAVLHIKYSPMVQGIISLFEGRKVWLKAGGLSFEPTGHNLEIIKENMDWVDIFDNRTSNPNISESPPDVSRYSSKGENWTHQDKASDKAKGRRRFALFMDPGTGKTKVGLDWLGQFWSAGEITGVLIIAAFKGIHRQWIENHIPKHYGANYSAAFWPIKEIPREIRPGENLAFLAINVDAVRTKRGKAICEAFLIAHKSRIAIVIDESHCIMNPSSKRWISCNGFGQRVLHKMILTGTPIAKSFLDEWAQLKWLDPKIVGIEYAKAFKNEFCLMGGFEDRQVIGHRNVERWLDVTGPHSFRVTSEEIGILPPTEDVWTFDLKPFQRRLMDDMKKTLIAQIESGEVTTAKNAAVAVMRIQQISHGFLTDDDRVIQYLFENPEDNPRMEALIEYIDANDGKIIVWARFHPDIKMIMDVLGKRAVHYYGLTKNKDRPNNIKRFIEDPKIRFFVSTAAAGGTGLDGLQTICNRAFYFAHSDNSIHRWQSRRRISRIGDMGGVSMTDAIAIGGVDRKMLRNCRNKEAIAAMGLGDIVGWLQDEY